MAYCSKCGTRVEDDCKFCPSCGASVNGASQPDFAAQVASVNQTADTTGEFDPADIQQNKVMAVLAYLSWLVLIPLLAAPNSKFARFHANQGLVLAITEIIYGILYSILSGILLAVSPYLVFITGIIGLLGIVFLVFSILGIVNAANGKAKELPLIGKIRILK